MGDKQYAETGNKKTRNSNGYNRRAGNGERVIILFAVSDEENNICYTAEALEIQTSKNRMYCPNNVSCVLVEFGEKEHARFWIKITNIKEEHTLKADMFRIISTEANLKKVILNLQFHFGYVRLSEDASRGTTIPF